MRPVRAPLMLILFVTALMQAAGSQAQEVKEADTVEVRETGDRLFRFLFNYDRSFVVSINRALPNSSALRAGLVAELVRTQQIGNVVFGWFGNAKPETLEVKLGSKVPVAVSQAAIRAASLPTDLPLIVSVMAQDGLLSDTQRIYIGALVKSGKPPMTRQKLDLLLSDQISHEKFLKALVTP